MAKKLNWFEYYFGHCFQTGWREIWNNFKMWRDLISGNYDGYALLEDDNPYEECYNWFWTSINMDECLGKDFIEHLLQMVEDIDSGKVKTYSMEDVMNELDNNT
jgi:hypothetical protein